MSRKKSRYDFIISYYVDKDCKVISYSKRIYHSVLATYNNLYRYRNLCSLEVYEDGELFAKYVGDFEIRAHLSLCVQGY